MWQTSQLANNKGSYMLVHVQVSIDKLVFLYKQSYADVEQLSFPMRWSKHQQQSIFKTCLDSYWLKIGYGHCESPIASLLYYI